MERERDGICEVKQISLWEDQGEREINIIKYIVFRWGW